MSQILTELAIKAIKDAPTATTYWDSLPGFGVRVGKRSKTYVVMRGKTRERVTIAKFDDIPLSEARQKAKKLLSAEPAPKATRKTFAEARTEFIEEHYTSKSPRTKDEAERLLTKHFKKLAGTHLSDIDDTDIEAALGKLKNTPSEQLHAFRAVRCFMRWCTRPPRRYIRHSPLEGYVPPGTDNKGTRILSDDELKAVWKAAGAPPHAVIRLLVLWGTRNSETVLIERSWMWRTSRLVRHAAASCPMKRFERAVRTRAVSIVTAKNVLL